MVYSKPKNEKKEKDVKEKHCVLLGMYGCRTRGRMIGYPTIDFSASQFVLTKSYHEDDLLMVVKQS